MYAFELVGEEDAFATYEVAAMAEAVRNPAPGIALANELSGPVAQLGWTRTVLAVVCSTRADIDAMTEALRAATLDRSGTLAVRARGIRGTPVDTMAIERALGAVLVDRGYAIDLEQPDHVVRVLVSGERTYIGWVIAEPGGDVGRRRPTDRPFFQPGSMAPRLARWLVNIARIEPDQWVIDPMCGTGGIVLEAAFVGASVIGADVQEHMVRGTRENVHEAGVRDRVHLLQGDAARLPLAENSVKAAIFDAPYGRQSKVAGEGLLDRALSESQRVAACAVVVADQPIDERAEQANWHVRKRFDRRVHRSLTRYIYHLVHTPAEDLGTGVG